MLLLEIAAGLLITLVIIGCGLEAEAADEGGGLGGWVLLGLIAGLLLYAFA